MSNLQPQDVARARIALIAIGDGLRQLLGLSDDVASLHTQTVNGRLHQAIRVACYHFLLHTLPAEESTLEALVAYLDYEAGPEDAAKVHYRSGRLVRGARQRKQ